MPTFNIKIFGRIKPSKKPPGIHDVEDLEQGNAINFMVPKQDGDGLINNKKENFKFRFDKIFPQPTSQEEVFDNVAKPVVDSVLAGFNGTIFAYGQTGSGKTFTMTGGPEKYSDRGIIPRTLSYIFEHCEQNKDSMYTVHVSYLEIYNENGYDLLDPHHEAEKLEDLPKVILMEDGDSNVHLKNLSMYPVANEEEALNALFLGDTNRMIAETPMNMASTRSHCIFSIYVTSRSPGSATVLRSKLHLVDLAGSERIGKTGVVGMLQTEAKYINLSLHYLEQVIVALSEKARSHIPYRNSMMTSVLRDSLGGNCMTTMVATISVDQKNIDESISTCRFAQRVALIKNDVSLNEETDPKIIIEKLKQEIDRLKAELQLARGGEADTGPLPSYEIDKCKEHAERFLLDPDPEAVLPLGDFRKISEALKHIKGKYRGVSSEAETRLQVRMKEQEEAMKAMAAQMAEQQHLARPAPSHTPRPASEGPSSSSENERLRAILSQRDTEISVLNAKIKKYKAYYQQTKQHPGASSLSTHSSTTSFLGQQGDPPRYPTSESSLPLLNHAVKKIPEPSSSKNDDNDKNHDIDKNNTTSNRHNDGAAASVIGPLRSNDQPRAEAFAYFKKHIADTTLLQEHRKAQKECHSKAQMIAEAVKTAQNNISALKAQIEKVRREQIAEKLINGKEDGVEEQETPLEKDLKTKIEAEKHSYKGYLSELKATKHDSEYLDHLLEKDKIQLEKDFDAWFASQEPPSRPTSNSSSQSSSTSDKHQKARDLLRLPTPDSGPNNNSSNSTRGTSQLPFAPPSQPSSTSSNSSFPLDKVGSNKSLGSSHSLLSQNFSTNDDIEAFYRARDKLKEAIRKN